MKRLQHLLVWLVGFEVLGALALAAWQVSRPQAPLPNLERLPASTAADIVRLRQATRGDSVSAWRELGEAYLGYGYLVEGEACLRRSATLAPRDFAAAYGWAYSLARLGRLQESNQKFEVAATLADRAMARTCRYHIGRNYLRLENGSAARQAFERIEGFLAADYQRAKLLVSQGDLKQARPLISQLEEQAPNDIEVQLLIIRVERDQSSVSSRRVNQLERCRATLQLTDHWEYLHPLRARHGLANALTRIEMAANAGQLAAAALRFEALERDNDPEQLTQLLGRAAEFEYRAGRLDETQRLLDLLAARSEMHPRWLHLRGDVWNALNQSQRAIEAWTRANEHFPRAESYEMLSAAAERAGDGVATVKNRSRARQVAGITAFREDQLPQALDLIEQSLKLDPKNARSWFYLGEVQSALSQVAAGHASYRTCLELNPNDGRCRVRLPKDVPALK